MQTVDSESNLMWIALRILKESSIFRFSYEVAAENLNTLWQKRERNLPFTSFHLSKPWVVLHTTWGSAKTCWFCQCSPCSHHTAHLNHLFNYRYSAIYFAFLCHPHSMCVPETYFAFFSSLTQGTSLELAQIYADINRTEVNLCLSW